MLVKDLGGYSGCRILLYEENGEYFVRKYSASISYNKRLETQCAKQESFVGKSVKAPVVLNKGYDENGIFYFDMEYVKGITLAKYISTIDVSKISDIAEAIINNIDFSLKKSSNSEVFVSKLLDLKEKTSEYKNSIIDSSLDYLLKYDWADFSQSSCHGDLTLENIIVKNGELYFIDFLDSFYDSWILDIGKVLQDVECMWSYRNDEKFEMNTKLRILILKEIILSKLKTINKKYVKDSYAALLLDLLRIYPYANDDNTINFLNTQTKSVLDKLRGDIS